MSASLLLAGMALEAVMGWPEALNRRIGHPVSWFGRGITLADRLLNRPGFSHPVRYGLGALATGVLILTAVGLTELFLALLPQTHLSTVVEIFIAASLLAGRNLYDHVYAVLVPARAGDVEAARRAVSRIVGRDPSALDMPALLRAGLESLAENTSDGLIAPIFWGLLLGLPGLVLYKAINTLDSMIGHRNERYAAFGGFAARLDDLANFIPARITGALFAISAGRRWRSVLKRMMKDAPHHRSPNAGWPEAALASALGVRLSGPRYYGGRVHAEPWLNGDAPDPSVEDLARGLAVYRRLCFLTAGLLAGVILLSVL